MVHGNLNRIIDFSHLVLGRAKGGELRRERGPPMHSHKKNINAVCAID
jgi:hypothetical protein